MLLLAMLAWAGPPTPGTLIEDALAVEDAVPRFAAPRVAWTLPTRRPLTATCGLRAAGDGLLAIVGDTVQLVDARGRIQKTLQSGPRGRLRVPR
ncbi:MAG: hypothetical protein AAF602_15120 [Myxococcota bacterium]